MPKSTSKSNAVHKLKELLQCDHVVVFGDGKNDIDMFQMADECYAMDNAVHELKEIATGIIGSNNNDGVAKWLLQNCS
jgi:hydroxymethylpyrimidine pyrophosphatase-like HAD family hydrolase